MKSVYLALFCLVVLNGVGWSDSLDICFDNTSCPTGYYCQKTPGDCSGAGVCAKKPTLCLDLWDPVCGCDGKTYSNSCYAAAAGVNVNYNGMCMPMHSCQSSDDCVSLTHFCSKPVGQCNGTGICQDRPSACPDVWEPVCGCDGKTYSNACYAAMAGVSVDFLGECEKACTDCMDCDPRYYCKKDPGNCYGIGQITLRPTACAAIVEPVCGCDGKTYSNACFAAMEGVNVNYEGPCASCVNPPTADLNKDCKVDIGDLAILAAQWMTCGLDRQEYCWVL